MLAIVRDAIVRVRVRARGGRIAVAVAAAPVGGRDDDRCFGARALSEDALSSPASSLRDARRDVFSASGNPAAMHAAMTTTTMTTTTATATLSSRRAHGARVAPSRPRAFASSSSARVACRRRERRVFASDDYEQADTDGPAIKVEIPLKDISRGKKIGTGSFGDVFDGTYKGTAVVLKERKLTADGSRFFQTEATLNRRLKNCKGVAPFVGVAGANAFLVWKDEGRDTLETVLNGGGGGGGVFGGLFGGGGGGGGGGGLAAAMNVGDETKAVKLFSKQLLQAVDAVHGAGVIHRDVKPNNILFARGGKIKLIDLGGAADLRVGTNYDKDETVFDPTYGPPEKYLDVKGVGNIFGAAAGWASGKPDLFDAFSCGMVILQCACPSLRKGKAMNGVKRDLNVYNYDAERWRDTLSEKRQEDFAILDADGGKGWDLVVGLLSQRKGRTSVKKALGHPFLR